jgi:hypothetical protein
VVNGLRAVVTGSHARVLLHLHLPRNRLERPPHRTHPPDCSTQQDTPNRFAAVFYKRKRKRKQVHSATARTAVAALIPSASAQ